MAARILMICGIAVNAASSYYLGNYNANQVYYDPVSDPIYREFKTSNTYKAKLAVRVVENIDDEDFIASGDGENHDSTLTHYIYDYDDYSGSGSGSGSGDNELIPTSDAYNSEKEASVIQNVIAKTLTTKSYVNITASDTLEEKSTSSSIPTDDEENLDSATTEYNYDGNYDNIYDYWVSSGDYGLEFNEDIIIHWLEVEKTATRVNTGDTDELAVTTTRLQSSKYGSNSHTAIVDDTSSQLLSTTNVYNSEKEASVDAVIQNVTNKTLTKSYMNITEFETLEAKSISSSIPRDDLYFIGSGDEEKFSSELTEYNYDYNHSGDAELDYNI